MYFLHSQIADDSLDQDLQFDDTTIDVDYLSCSNSRLPTRRLRLPVSPGVDRGPFFRSNSKWRCSDAKHRPPNNQRWYMPKYMENIIVSSDKSKETLMVSELRSLHWTVELDKKNRHDKTWCKLTLMIKISRFIWPGRKNILVKWSHLLPAHATFDVALAFL